MQIYARQFKTSSIIPLPFVLLKMENVERNGKKERSFLGEIKTFFLVFQGLSFGEKIKKLIKNSGHKLYSSQKTILLHISTVLSICMGPVFVLILLITS